MSNYSSRGFAAIRMILIALCALPAYGQSTSTPQKLMDSKYSVLSGDLNGDGKTEYLVDPKTTFYVIPTDKELKIFPRPLKNPPLLLTPDGAGGYVLSVVKDMSVRSKSIWRSTGYSIKYGDILGGGAEAMLLQSNSPGVPAFTIARKSPSLDPYLVEVLTKEAIGIDISQTNIAVDLSDQNSDSRSDLLVYVDGVVSSVITADVNGIFHPTSINMAANTAASVSVVWNKFVSAMNSNNPAEALKYLAPEAQEVYANAINSAGPDLALTFSGVLEHTVINAHDNVATAVLKITDSGVTKIYPIAYRSTENGWKIISF